MDPGVPKPLCVVALVLTFACRTAPTPRPTTPPNVLFLFADDQRADAVGAVGNPFVHTPNLDRLAEAGHVFRNAYCMGSIHGAVCQPSRAMLMSGRTLYHVSMDLDGTTLMPEWFGRHGYQTFGTGKWHNGRPSFARAFQQGRTVFFGGMSDHTKVPVVDLKDDGTYTEPTAANGFSSEVFADAAIEFLRHRDPTRPFFAYVSFTAPHDPRQPPEPYRQRAYDDPPPLPPNFLPQHPFHNGWMVGRDETLAPWPRTPEVVGDQLAEYYGMIAHLDAQVGRILAALEDSGAADNTLIVYTADHGLAIGSHGLLGKQSVYEHSMKAPLFVSGPGIEHDESAALVYLYDLFPTLCGLAGLPVPGGVEGADLTAVISGGAPPRDTLFLTYEDIQRAVRDRRWKLIRYPRIHRTQLFDLWEDPHEMQDLSDDPMQAERVQDMLARMAEWQRCTDDPHPLTAAEKESEVIDLSGRPRKPDSHQPAWIVEKYFGGRD